MKKFIILAILIAVFAVFTIPAALLAEPSSEKFAVQPGAGHPAVPFKSLDKVPPSAVNGMHTSIMNLDPYGVAYHVHMTRFVPDYH